MRGFCLEVSGEYACFTRPEMKVERVSYDIPTPSSIRAIFDAILWKPAIFWRVRKFEVLAPIRWISVRRNEVGKVMTNRSDGIFIEDDRQQRAGLFLRDVKYRYYADFVFIPPEQRPEVFNPMPEWFSGERERETYRQSENRPDEKEAKYAAMFERRAKKGQVFTAPYLGSREFSARFRLIADPFAEPAEIPEELKGERDFGWMLYDLDFSDPNDVRPLYYKPVMKDGVVMVPDRHNREEVRG